MCPFLLLLAADRHTTEYLKFGIGAPNNQLHTTPLTLMCPIMCPFLLLLEALPQYSPAAAAAAAAEIHQQRTRLHCTCLKAEFDNTAGKPTK
jgi:hypothetical protein